MPLVRCPDSSDGHLTDPHQVLKAMLKMVFCWIEVIYAYVVTSIDD